MTAELYIDPAGNVRAIYSDDRVGLLAELAQQLGSEPVTRRASHVEPATDGGWTADMSPSGGPVLTGFRLRSEALAAEIEWLREHGLGAAA